MLAHWVIDPRVVGYDRPAAIGGFGSDNSSKEKKTHTASNKERQKRKY